MDGGNGGTAKKGQVRFPPPLPKVSPIGAGLVHGVG